MIRSILFASALSLALVGPALVRAQDDDKATSMKIELKDGKVHVQIRTEDGKTVDRELDASEFFRRLFDEPDHRSMDGQPGTAERLDRLRERFSQLRRQDRKPGDDEDDDGVLKDLEKTLKSLPKKLEDALGGVKEKLDPEKARELERRLKKALRDIKDAIDPETPMARVKVEGKEMEVPAQKGKARLY